MGVGQGPWGWNVTGVVLLPLFSSVLSTSGRGATEHSEREGVREHEHREGDWQPASASPRSGACQQHLCLPPLPEMISAQPEGRDKDR